MKSSIYLFDGSQSSEGIKVSKDVAKSKDTSKDLLMSLKKKETLVSELKSVRKLLNLIISDLCQHRIDPTLLKSTAALSQQLKSVESKLLTINKNVASAIILKKPTSKATKV
jgi:hypothetical protein